MINLRELREKKKITQEKLGDMLGVSQCSISLWESGKVNPDVTILIKLSEILSCTADELLGIDHSAGEGETI